MPSQDFIDRLPDELNRWAVRVFDTIRKHFVDYDINRYAGEKGPEYTGDLYRKMWWTVHNAAGGSPALIRFFYMKYGDFVQWGVGTGVPKWPVPKMQEREPIRHPSKNRKAKPAIRSEIRYHLRWLQKRLAEQYGYLGRFYIVKGVSDGVDDKSITEKWIREHRKELGEDLARVLGAER